MDVEIKEGEVLTSYDVTALCTSVPGKEMVEKAVKRANKDPTWYNRTLMTLEEFGELLLMVVETTYLRSLNRCIGCPWGHHYPLAYPTSSWKNLKIRH